MQSERISVFKLFSLPGSDHLVVLLVLGHSKRIDKEDQLSEKPCFCSFPFAQAPGWISLPPLDTFNRMKTASARRGLEPRRDVMRVCDM